MTQFPDLEARVRAQETMTTIFHARFEELSRDMTVSFQQQVKYQAATERELDIRFRHIDARLDRLEANMATKEDLASLEGRIKENITSLDGRIKEDLASLDGRIRENMTSLDGRIATLEQRFTSMENKFDQVLQMVAALTKKLAE